MRSQTLGQTGIKTSALGFGCVQLTSHSTRAEAVQILEHAFACGITHFDVARAYGFGRAEGILAEFLRSKRDQVTVATKLGLQPPSGLTGSRWVIDAAKKVLGPFPSLLRRAKRHGETASARNFSPQTAIQSLQTSLRELRTDYVDVLLLHEATVADATNDALLEALQKEVATGTVRSIGIASDFAKLPHDVSLLPRPYSIVQFNEDVIERNLSKLVNGENSTFITHSIFKPAKQIHAAATAHPQIVREFSSQTGADLRDPAVVNSLLLHYASWSNHAGVVLFSSTDPAHITANVSAVESPLYNPAQLAQFVSLVDEILTPRAIQEPQSATAPRMNAS